MSSYYLPHPGGGGNGWKCQNYESEGCDIKLTYTPDTSRTLRTKQTENIIMETNELTWPWIIHFYWQKLMSVILNIAGTVWSSIIGSIWGDITNMYQYLGRSEMWETRSSVYDVLIAPPISLPFVSVHFNKHNQLTPSLLSYSPLPCKAAQSSPFDSNKRKKQKNSKEENWDLWLILHGNNIEGFVSCHK